MAGLNGISLPATIESSLAPITSSLALTGIVFQGLLPLGETSIHPLVALLLLLIGHAIAWGLPNIHQVMGRYKIVTEDLVVSAKNELERKQLVATQRWAWQIDLRSAVGLGLLFAALIIAMATNKPSTFLYYQF